MQPELDRRSEECLGANAQEAPAQLRLLSEAAGNIRRDASKQPGSIWTPTLSDFLFLSLIVWLFLAGPNGWAALLSDGDTGWHIRVGDWIREHRAFPRQDFLSFSKEGQPWFAWEWGAEVLMSVLHSFAGMKGVLLGLGILIPAYLVIGFRHAIWRGATPLIALPILLFASGSSAIHFLARPHVFTLFFLAAGLWLIEADRRAPSPRIWLLVPMTVVWTNLHGGFLSLVACLALVAGGSVLGKQWPLAKRYGVITVLCLAASLANPYGYHLHEHIFAYLRNDWIKEVVDEFQSPSFRSEAMLFYEVLLLVSVMTVYRTVRRGEWVDSLLVLAWAHFSLSSVRHVPIFLLVAGPILAGELSAWWNEIASSLSRRSILRTFDQLSRDLHPRFVRNSVWVIVPVLLLAAVDRPIPWPKTFPEAKFPIAFVERHQSDLAGKRVLTTDEWGDYLSYRFYPQQRVFFDGRSDFFGEALGKDYLKLMQGGPLAEEQMERFRFDAALLPPSWSVHLSLRRNPKWELVAENEKVILLRRRMEPAAGAF